MSDERTVAERFIEGLWRLERERDVEPLVALHADDREVGHVISPRRFSGKEGARDFCSRYRAAFDDVESRFHGILIDGGGAALEWTTEGTSAEGAPFRYDGVNLVTIDGGAVSRFRASFNPAALGAQFQHAPHDAGWRRRFPR